MEVNDIKQSTKEEEMIAVIIGEECAVRSEEIELFGFDLNCLITLFCNKKRAVVNKGITNA
jgi:hypothetical protein